MNNIITIVLLVWFGLNVAFVGALMVAHHIRDSVTRESYRV